MAKEKTKALRLSRAEAIKLLLKSVVWAFALFGLLFIVLLMVLAGFLHADIGGRDLLPRIGEHLKPPAEAGKKALALGAEVGRVPLSAAGDQLREREDLFRLLPGIKIAQHVCPHQEEKFVLREALAEKAHIEEGRASRRALPLKQMRKNMGSECERFFCSASALIDYRYIIRHFCPPVKFFAKIYGGIVAFCQSLAAFCAERPAVCAAAFGIL